MHENTHRQILLNLKVLMHVSMQIALNRKNPLTDTKEATSQVAFQWWARWDLNPRPRDYESPALTTELQAQTLIMRSKTVTLRSASKIILLEQDLHERARSLSARMSRSASRKLIFFFNPDHGMRCSPCSKTDVRGSAYTYLTAALIGSHLLCSHKFRAM